MVFEWFAELLMNMTRETVEPAMRAAADEICGDYPDIVPTDTRNLMGFFTSLRRLMMEVRMDLLLILNPTSLVTSNMAYGNIVRCQ